MAQTILIVDDDYYYRELLSIILLDNDYSVETADSGAEALQMIAQKTYDQVLLDNAMYFAKSGCFIPSTIFRSLW